MKPTARLAPANRSPLLELWLQTTAVLGGSAWTLPGSSAGEDSAGAEHEAFAATSVVATVRDYASGTLSSRAAFKPPETSMGTIGPRPRSLPARGSLLVGQEGGFSG